MSLYAFLVPGDVGNATRCFICSESSQFSAQTPADMTVLISTFSNKQRKALRFTLAATSTENAFSIHNQKIGNLFTRLYRTESRFARC